MGESFQNAVAHFQSGRWPEAISICRGLLRQDGRNVDALQMLGLALCHAGQLREGARVLTAALDLRPNDAAILNNLGEIYRQQGQLTNAEATLRRAMTIKPQFAEAAFNLANTLRDDRRMADAIDCFQQAVAWRPEYAKAHLNLANLLRAEGRLPRAVVHYQQYLRLQPPRADVLLSLAGVHADLGDQILARDCIMRAAALEPDNSTVIVALGNVNIATGNVAEARQQYGRLASRLPKCLLARLRLETVNPVIPESRNDIEENRTRVLAAIAELRDQRLALNVSSLHTSGAEPPMAWAYQGLDNRPLKEAYADLFADAIQPMTLRPRTGKPRVGIVVTDGHEGVYSECLGRLVSRLPNPDLEVSVVCSAAGANILRHLLGDTGLPHFVIPDRVDEAAIHLRNAEFDLLHYWEIGTGSLNYFLPFLRPAPVQSTCWGWPVTSGQPHVDYFVSSSLIESDNADAHYTENLIRLETLPTWYARPPAPTHLKTRAACGLPSQGSLYLCTQNLRKYHPDFDTLLGQLLRRDLEGYVCVIEDSQPSISRLLRGRFDRCIPDVAKRILFLPRKTREEYLHIVSLADVILDTLHYGGGANSLYDAFACGTPVVTLPGLMHRSRYGLGAYRKMGIQDLVADSEEGYVCKAVEVAQQPDLRRQLKLRIDESSHLLFADNAAVVTHREFLLKAVAISRQAESRM